MRYDFSSADQYQEVLGLKPANVRLSHLNTGAPLLNTHKDGDLNDVIGVVVKRGLSLKRPAGRSYASPRAIPM
jgi:hypothetical protein